MLAVAKGKQIADESVASELPVAEYQFQDLTKLYEMHSERCAQHTYLKQKCGAILEMRESYAMHGLSYAGPLYEDYITYTSCY